MIQLLNERDIEFLLYEFLNTEELINRAKYAEHSKEVFDASIQTAKKIAEKYFANHNAKGDQQEPTFDGKTVQMIPEVKVAWDAFAEAGFLAAHYDFEDGGMQLPDIILRVAMAYITAANVASSGYSFLTIGAGNLIDSFGTDAQKDRYLSRMKTGEFAGTMALTEPAQGSALADITTKAVPQNDGTYRIFGQKIYISGGDQSLTNNIVHMVLARIEGAPLGTKGISLFICPKVLVNEDGSLGERNDVALAGLLHKMGYRNTTSTVLSFGEAEGAEAYLLGEPHKGLSYMFQMMNEARIGVGMGASVLGYQGYLYSLDYAKGRPQGRLPSQRDPKTKQVNIIEHADVKRMLLAQKVYSEGSLALCLYASSLHEDTRTAADDDERKRAAQVLDLLTPIIKSYPSKYGLKANELAIQVLGGSGYIREYPVEQYYRDNRLNPIHEGTEGIQAQDLLGRKVVQAQGAAYREWALLVVADIENANPAIAELAKPLGEALDKLNKVTQGLAMKLLPETELALANASEYLDMFGRVVMAWIWFRKANIAVNACTPQNLHEDEANFYLGKLQAARFFFDWELPQIHTQAGLLLSMSAVTSEMRAEWF
jgi:butyryl-CoA dehydrogenase